AADSLIAFGSSRAADAPPVWRHRRGNMAVAPRWIVTVLASAAGATGLWMGGRIWTTPVRYEVVEGTDDGSVTSPRFQNRRFADVSALGPLPLIVPVLILGCGGWMAIRGSRWGVFSSAVGLGIFAVISGFSIGGAYRPAVYLLMAAAVAGFFMMPDKPRVRGGGSPAGG